MGYINKIGSVETHKHGNAVDGQDHGVIMISAPLQGRLVYATSKQQAINRPPIAASSLFPAVVTHFFCLLFRICVGRSTRVVKETCAWKRVLI